jgi:3-deoxy-D-manno-octulosonate 8-phosphate phosphatase (KDO 8-P phosphatase)
MLNKQLNFDRIKTLIFDVDGVLTDGRIHLLESGEQYRTFDIKDSYSLEVALKAGFRVGIVSSANAAGTRTWLETLKVEDIFMGGPPDQKLNAYLGYVTRDDLDESEILYMGDDIIDCPILKRPDVLSTCPADAVEEVKAMCAYVSPKMGGHGAVRDVVEQVLKAQGKWTVA